MNWIPDFSQPIALLRALLVAVGIATLLAVLRNGSDGLDIGIFGPLVFLSVWVCCLSAVGLQLLRTFGSRLPLWVGATIALVWMLFSAAFCATAPFWLGMPGYLLSEGGPMKIALEAMLVTLIMGAVVLRVFFAHYETQEQQRRLLQAKYDALQARIRPHFLFNSLNTVAELIAIDAERAENAVLDLSDLFRATLSDQGAVPISQELKLCEKYLGVEKLRMGDRLSWSFDIDEDAMHWRLPALSLQPLVENAVLHGVQPIPDGGLIEVSLNIVDQQLELRIKNPLPTHSDGKTSQRGTGTALINIQARLETFFQTPVKFKAGEQNGHYLVELLIPNLAKSGTAA